MGCTCSDPSPPVVINPGATAGQQATYNREAALEQRALNMVDQYTPQGSMQWSPELTAEGDPYSIEGIPQFRATTEYSPEQQGLYETSTRLAQQYGDIGETMLGGVRDRLSQPFTISGNAPPSVGPGGVAGWDPTSNIYPGPAPAGAGPRSTQMPPSQEAVARAAAGGEPVGGYPVGPTPPGTPGGPQAAPGQVGPSTAGGLPSAPQINEGVRTRTLENILARAQPQMSRDEEALHTRLVNQGFAPGSEGYDSSMDQIARAQTDFRLGADVSAGNEMARMYGLEASSRDRAINEMLMERNQPMSELAAFMSGSQPTAPSFVSVPQGQIAPPDYMGAAFGSANMQNQAQAQRNQGLYGLLGTGAQVAGMTYGGPSWSWGG